MFVDQVSSATLFLDGILEHPKNNFGLFLFCQGLKIRSVKENIYLLGTARSSGILKAKQKLGRTFNSDKLGGIAFTKCRLAYRN